MEVIYNVTLAVSQEVEKEWVEWMKTTHIKEVLKTKMFTKATFTKLANEETYAVQYFAQSKEDYLTYIDKYSANLRDKTFQKFGDKVLAFRTLLEVIEIFN